jgi:predicted nucleotidyltransferase
MVVANSVISTLRPVINTWAGNHLEGIYISGSVAKGTVVADLSDVDILISIKPTATESLKEVYDKLHNTLGSNGYVVRKQNVSLGITIDGGWKVDIVPAKKQSAWTTEHSLWSHKMQAWRSTNIHQHVSYVTSSGRAEDIRLIKIWKKLHNIEFPSFLLEVVVIDALRGMSYDNFANNFAIIMTYIRDNITTRRVIDPTKPSNILSDELTSAEKKALSTAAANSLNLNWEKVLW